MIPTMTHLPPQENFPGPVLLLAGPGTGKTHTLALRTKWLIEQKQTSAEEITIITFTGEAARNMNLRIGDPEKQDVFIKPNKRPRQISTMHSLGQQILSANLRKAGLRKSFRVITSDSLRELLIEDSAQLAGFGRGDAKEVTKRRSQGHSLDAQEPKSKIEAMYRELMRACNAVDYDEQILLACKLLSENADIRDHYKAKAKHLLVDEYQDINAAQFEMIRLLSEGQAEGLFVVGDDDQSIYGWRGGSPEFLRGFKQHFGNEAKVESLPTCYRCAPHVLQGAVAVVTAFNANRMPKSVPQCKRQAGPKIVCHDVPSQQKEAEIITAMVAEAMPLRDVLILVPSRKFAPPIQAAPRRRRISYDCSGSVDISGFRLIQTLADWLDEPDDGFALRLCIQAMIDCGIGGVPSPRVRKDAQKAAREQALGTVSALWNPVIQDGKSLHATLVQEAGNNPLLKTLFDAVEDIRASHEKGIQEFVNAVVKSLRPWRNSAQFIEQIRGWMEESSGRSGANSNGVARILTLQSAKGLEADCVFVVGFDEGILPKSNLSSEELAETSRLVYVSMTRAKEELHLFHARKREGAISYLLPTTGDGQFATLKPSPFLAAIPQANKEARYVQSEEAKKRANAQAASAEKANAKQLAAGESS